jgi:hypothetical protein
VADIIFAFDPAIDRPIPVPEDAPPAVGESIALAAREALDGAVAAAKAGRSRALVLCGRILDPERASPAQAAHLRKAILELAAGGCRTIVVADETTACHDLARMLGEPRSLSFVTPLAPLALDVHGMTVELVSAHGPPGTTLAATTAEAAVLERRILIGWDSGLWAADRWTRDVQAAAAESNATEPPRSVAAFTTAALSNAAWSHPGTFWIWGSRRRQPLPVGVHHLPPLQARSGHEATPGSCHGLTLVEPASSTDRSGLAAPKADWRGSWHDIPTHRVVWRTISVESVAGGDEELATAVWAALEAAVIGGQAVGTAVPPIEIVRCSIECGASIARRVRVAEIAAETLARVRQLYDPKSFRVWCREVFAAPGESLAALGHARSGGRPGSTTSFSSALADIVTAVEQAAAPPIPPDLAREAGWLALELVEST